ncbi:MAG: response regulator transcription factor [Candidatus Eisenbacteria bacterium]|uniref:Response regulator transcription factor n=1 Tax=Eiseniibacteriota bacterium TaxID=2212470 RepID=A0A7Y2H1P7_UNCEI|nr:response regulator transcription factor [Candidatus Eisenbacteria bacterium]
MRILIVEDNPKMGEAIRKGLAAAGYVPELLTTAAEGESKALQESFDLILLDVMLPDGNGVEICRNLRGKGLSVPILMLTALSGTKDKVTGLDSGADDYITKPFTFDELLARIRALLRRGRVQDSQKLTCDDLVLDVNKRQALRGDKQIDLSTKEFMLLEYFLNHQNRVISKQDLAKNVWDLKFEPTSNVIEVYISTLRKKIDQGFKPLIHTVVGAGYRFGTHD